MVQISLRAYNREIENQVQSGNIDEAIAHCRFILQHYPKHIDTYRLLGKAYLEDQRYSDASDILKRVLSSVPDDFLSHLGMSIIREDEGNLDDAIWHMERAFELQPANAAIKAELRRLYGRRDGVEPPKIHLTRGALARMYAKGNLYEQAIAELRTALAEDPQRPDLQILLARVYHLTGKRVEAVEICSPLLKKSPYCLEANRILAEILPETKRATEAQAYRQRVQALDPYYAHLPPGARTSDQVPDTAVNLEKYTWMPGEAVGGEPARPDWAVSLGVELEKEGQEELERAEIPDWLKVIEPSETEESQLAEYDSTSGEEDLSWLEEPGEEPELPTGMEEAQAEALEEPAPTPAAPEGEPQIPEWLGELGKETPEEAELFKAPAEVESLEEGEVEAVSEEIGGLLEEQPQVPEWQSSLESETPEEEPLTQPEERPEEPLEWQKKIAPQPERLEEAIDAYEIPESEQIEPEAPELFEDEAETKAQEEGVPEPASEIPEWLRGLADETTEEVETEDKEAIEWPSEAGLEEGVLIEGDTQPVKVREVIPESDEVILEALPEAEVEKGEIPESPPSSLEETSPAISKEEEEAALAWLESLAQRKGAFEGELFTPPDERMETPPEWIQQLAAEAEIEEFVYPEEAEQIEPTLSEAEEEPAELVFEEEQLQAEEAEALIEEPEVEEPFQTSHMEEELIEAQPVTTETAKEQPELPEWLSEFAAEEAQEEEKVSWTLPAEEVEAATTPSEISLTEEEEKPPEETRAPQIMINSSSLAQLEQIPGIGYVTAQSIISYREEHGHFTSLDELLNVPGIGPVTLGELKKWVGIEEVEVEAIPMVGTPEYTLTAARNAFVAGEITSALENYTNLIQAEQLLDQVIQDLQEASYRHPMEISVYEALGDAYVRNEQLQEALEAYNKAEDLIS